VPPDAGNKIAHKYLSAGNPRRMYDAGQSGAGTGIPGLGVTNFQFDPLAELGRQARRKRSIHIVTRGEKCRSCMTGLVLGLRVKKIKGGI
jgi:hypothetical protein